MEVKLWSCDNLGFETRTLGSNNKWPKAMFICRLPYKADLTWLIKFLPKQSAVFIRGFSYSQGQALLNDTKTDLVTLTMTLWPQTALDDSDMMFTSTSLWNKLQVAIYISYLPDYIVTHSPFTVVTRGSTCCFCDDLPRYVAFLWARGSSFLPTVRSSAGLASCY